MGIKGAVVRRLLSNPRGRRAVIKLLTRPEVRRGAVKLARNPRVQRAVGTQLVLRRLGRGKTTREAGRPYYRGAVGLGISALVALIIGRRKNKREAGRTYYGGAVGLGIGTLGALVTILLSFWLLRRRAGEETAPTTPAPEEGVESALLEEEEEVGVASAPVPPPPPPPPSAEDALPREGPPTGEQRPEGMAPSQAPHRDYYKSGVLEGGGDMKIRLYSIEQYRDELGGTATRGGGFIAVLKAYRQLEDGEWHDYAPNEAAEVLELAPEDYEVDGERSALLLRRLPPGMPFEARDLL